MTYVMNWFPLMTCVMNGFCINTSMSFQTDLLFIYSYLKLLGFKRFDQLNMLGTNKASTIVNKSKYVVCNKYLYYLV
jgi:hypothetical protein